MTLESACIPIPSEVIMLSGGVMAGQGRLTLTEVVVAGVLGNVTGSAIAYFAGATMGRNLFGKYGKYIFFRERHKEKAERWFARYGEWTVFFTRNLPFIRTFISLPAGLARMGFPKFILYTVLGCIPWNWALAFLGLKLGSNWQTVDRYLRPVSYFIAGVIAISLALWIYHAFRTRRRIL
ncbi:DedA family protein [Paenibacillus hodogayensis]